MVTRTFQTGLLVAVFGAALFAGNTGTTRELGMLVLLLGVGVGFAGVLRDERSDRVVVDADGRPD